MMLVKSSAKAATIPVCIVEDPNQLIVLHARKMCIVLIIQKRVRVINVLVNRSTMMQENPSVKSVIIVVLSVYQNTAMLARIALLYKVLTERIVVSLQEVLALALRVSMMTVKLRTVKNVIIRARPARMEIYQINVLVALTT